MNIVPSSRGITEPVSGTIGAQSSSVSANGWGGERTDNRKVRDLEAELAEKDRYIKQLEMQMLASSVSKQSSASAYESDIAQVSGVDSPANVQSWGSIPKMIDFDKAQSDLLREPTSFTTIGTSQKMQCATGSSGHDTSEKIISGTQCSRDAMLTRDDLSQKKEEDVYDVTILQRMLQEARAEIERKNAELRIFQTARSAAELQHEYSLLLLDIYSLSEQKDARLQERERPAVELVSRSSSNDAPMSPSSSAHWRSKAGMLDEDLKRRNEVVTRLRQRELWLETQIRRQAETNVMPLDSLLSELRALQEGSEKVSRKLIPGQFRSETSSIRDQLHAGQSKNSTLSSASQSGQQDKGTEVRSASGMQWPTVPAFLTTQNIAASSRNVVPVELVSQQYC